MKSLRLILLLALFQTAIPSRATTNQFFVLANSIGGQPSWFTNFYVLTVPYLPNSTWGGTNCSESGKDSYELGADLGVNTSIFQNRDYSSITSAVAFLEIGNSIFHGSNTAWAVHDYSNTAWMLHTNGNAVLVMTPWERSDETPANGQSNSLYDAAALLRTNSWTFIAGVVDTATNALLNYRLHPESFQADKIHPSAAGATNIANQLGPAMLRILFSTNLVSVDVGRFGTVHWGQ